MTVGDGRSTPLEASACEKSQPPAPADVEVSGKAVANCCFLASACGNPSRNPDAEKPSNGNDVTKDPALLQYLYVQSPAGKGCPCRPHHVFPSLPVSPDQGEQQIVGLCPSRSRSPQTKVEAPVLCSTTTGGGVKGYILNALHFI